MCFCNPRQAWTNYIGQEKLLGAADPCLLDFLGLPPDPWPAGVKQFVFLCSEHKTLMAGYWVLMSLQLKDPESWGVARALYKLPLATIKGHSWHSYIKEGPCPRVTVCVCMYLNLQPSSRLLYLPAVQVLQRPAWPTRASCKTDKAVIQRNPVSKKKNRKGCGTCHEQG